MPASALEGFKILIKIVSFDFFEPFEYLDVGFTSTDSWSPQFEWLGFGSSTFAELLGSLILVSLIHVVIICITIFLSTMGKRH